MKSRLRSSVILIALCAFFAAGQVWAAEDKSTADWTSLKREGDAAFSGNNYGIAERNLTQALKEAEKFPPGDIRLADTLRSLAALYSTRGQFNKAEPLLEQELHAREKSLGSENPQVVSDVGKLTQFYIEHGSPEKADKLCNLLAGFAERRVKEQVAIKSQFGNIEHFFDRSKGYTQARSMLEKAQTETDRTTANENLELATTLDSIAHLYQANHKFTMAERLYKSALTFRELTLSSNHLALAYSYENLANLYQSEGKNSLAEPYFKKSLDVTESVVQPGRGDAYKRLDELAQSHANLGQISEAESLYKRALILMDKAGSHGDAGRASLALANLYVRQGRYGEAVPLMKRALSAAESANGPQHVSVAAILESYAEVLEKLSKNGEAARMRARARAIRGAGIEKADAGSHF